MIVFMPDVFNPFSPLPKSRVLLNLKNSKSQIEDILDKVASTFDSSNKHSPLGSTGSCGGAALKAAIDLLKDDSGKVLWFFMDIPSVGYGSLRNRNSRSLYGTEKEKTLLVPEEKTKAYVELASIGVKERVGVDLFACTQNDVDLASIVPVATLTGGEVYYYSPFNSTEYGEKLHFDLFRNLTRQTVYDVSIRARCSLGLSVHKYYGSFGETLDGPIQLSTMDADKTIAFTLKQTSKLNSDTPAYLQFAILYTTGDNQRKVRVFNYTMAVTNSISHVYSSIDMDGLIGLEARVHMATMQKQSLGNTRNELCETCIRILAHYRKAVSTSSASGQFVLPESMKVYPLLLLSLMKTPAYGLMDNVRLDAKVANIIQLSELSFTYLLMRLYPKMYSVAQIINPEEPYGTLIINPTNNTESNAVFKPVNLPCSADKIVPTDAYLIANSDFIYVYLPKDVSESILMEVFGKSTVSELVPEEGIPFLETEGNTRVRNVIDNLRKERGGAYQQVKVLVHTSSQTGAVLRELLVEDCKNPQHEFSYVHFLSHLHRMVLNRMQTI
eukprot:TRINITY_DN48_c0_g1_i10.p1 TRINITY_DN48_c0_g1~~TRINITY_DN48_c0_g1_i10.p1  ORF type:complete len:555 (-),score=206.36 TRINITY_DN48_c0_g1_i10:96-1760(-)